MSRPEFYEVELLSHPRPVRLCRCCFAVLVGEGMVAGDPTAPGYVASLMTAAHRSNAESGCVTCASLREYEVKRSRLAAPPQRIGLETCAECNGKHPEEYSRVENGRRLCCLCGIPNHVIQEVLGQIDGPCGAVLCATCAPDGVCTG